MILKYLKNVYSNMMISLSNQKNSKTIIFHFFIFVINTLSLIFYPYFSYHPTLMPSICLLIIINAFSLCAINNYEIPKTSLLFILLYLIILFPGIIQIKITSIYSEKSLQTFTKIAYFILCSFLLSDEKNNKLFISIILSSLIVYSLHGMWQYLFGFKGFIESYANELNFLNETYLNDSNKINLIFHKLNLKSINSIFTNKNVFASFLILAYPIFFTTNKNNCLKLYPLIFIPLFSIFFIDSKSGILLSIISLPLFTISKSRKYFIATLIIISTLVFTSPLFLSPLESWLSSSMISRLNYWKTTYCIIKSNLFFGIGFDSYYSEFLKNISFNEEMTRFAHNHFLEFAAENGVFAGIIFFMLIILSISHPLEALKNFSNKDIDHDIIKRTFLYSCILIFILFYFFPPFKYFNNEFSFLFSLFFGFIFLILTFYIYLKSKYNNETFLYFSKTGAALFFLYSLVDINLDKLLNCCIFFGFIGHLTSTIPYIGKESFIKISKLSIKLFLLLGMFISTSVIFSSYYISKAEEFKKQNNLINSISFYKKASIFTPLNANILLPLNTLILQKEINTDNKNIVKFINNIKSITSITKDKVQIWRTLANLSLQFNHIKELHSYGVNYINNALKLSPTDLNLLFLKAKLLEKLNNSEEANKIYKEILKHQNEKFNYVFHLKKHEIQEIETKLNTY